MPKSIGDEKYKVFRSMLPMQARRTWCAASTVGYRDEDGVDPESETETFIALKCFIDNWRWAGVPFFLRTGKKFGRGAADYFYRVSRAPQEHVS